MLTCTTNTNPSTRQSHEVSYCFNVFLSLSGCAYFSALLSTIDDIASDSPQGWRGSRASLPGKDESVPLTSATGDLPKTDDNECIADF